jgi:arginyl-tRNA synthetase
MDVATTIKARISDVLNTLGVVATPESIHLEHTDDFSHGDYATSVALAYAKQTGKNPRALAEEIVSALGTIEGVSKIEVAGPGFINFFLGPEVFAQKIVETGNMKWGSNTALASETTMIEYTSPNLFKPLHIGNLVGNVLGESLSRLMEWSGAQVIRANYPSDIGLTVAKGVWGLIKTSGDPSLIQSLGDAYRVGNDGYDNDAEAKIEIESINKKLYEGTDNQLNKLRRQGIATSRAHLAALCATLGTRFDLEIFESQAAPVGLAIVQDHVADVFEKSDGAIVLTGEKSGIHTRVFVNSKGLPTYEAKDLGNFTLKQQAYPDVSRYYVVTGVEQQEYFKVVIAAIRMIFPEASKKIIEHIPTGFLTLTTGKMSSRKGNVLTGESLLADLEESARERATLSRADDKDALASQIAVAAIKYQILKQGSGKNIIFDREKALSMEGDSGPYLQYAHARTCAIVEKARGTGIIARTDASLEANEVMRLVYRFPEVVAHATRELEPHIVTQYLITLASTFNSWYAQEHILDGTPSASHKVAIVDAVRSTLQNGLWLLGISAPNKM